MNKFIDPETYLRILYSLSIINIHQNSPNHLRLMKLSGVICTICLHILCKNHDPTAKNNNSLLSNRKFFIVYIFFLKNSKKI